MPIKIDYLLDNFVDPYGELYNSLRDRLFKGMTFSFKVHSDKHGPYLLLKSGKKYRINSILSVLMLCVDPVIPAQGFNDYLIQKATFDQLQPSEIKLFEDVGEFARLGCYKPVIYFGNNTSKCDLVNIEVKSKNHVIYNIKDPIFQIYSSDIFNENSHIFNEKDKKAFSKNKEITIFIKANELIRKKETREGFHNPEIFHRYLLTFYLNSVFLRSEELFNERLKIFGINESPPEKVLLMLSDPSQLKTHLFKDCLKMDILCNLYDSIEDNSKVLSQIDDKYNKMIKKIDSFKEYYAQNKIVKEFEWDY